MLRKSGAARSHAGFALTTAEIPRAIWIEQAMNTPNETMNDMKAPVEKSFAGNSAKMTNTAAMVMTSKPAKKVSSSDEMRCERYERARISAKSLPQRAK